jgi:Transposase
VYESLAAHVVGRKARQVMATRKRHSPEQIVRKLMAADRLLAEGKDTAAVCRELGVSEATYHRWRNQFGGLKSSGETSRPGTPAGNCSSRPAGAGGQRTVRLPGDRAIPRYPTPRTCRGPHRPIPMSYCGRGCASTPGTIRVAASGRRVTMLAVKDGSSITRESNAFGVRKVYGCRSGAAVNATAPRQHR